MLQDAHSKLAAALASADSHADTSSGSSSKIVDALSQLTAALEQLCSAGDAANGAADGEHEHELLEPAVHVLLSKALASSNSHVNHSAIESLVAYLSALSSAPASPSRTKLLLGTSSRPNAGAANALEPLSPLAFARLGDAREKTRVLAGIAIAELARTIPATSSSEASASELNLTAVVRPLIEGPYGLVSKNSRAKESSLKVLASLRAVDVESSGATSNAEGKPLVPLRPFIAPVVSLLSDADERVRSSALATAKLVFGAPSVPAQARADLKRELLKQGTSKKTSDQLLDAVFSSSSTTGAAAGSEKARGTPQPGTPRASSPIKRSAGSRVKTTIDVDALPANAFPPESSSAAGTAAPSAAPAPSAHVATERELTDELESYIPIFDGKETEHNWQARERAISRLRALTGGEDATHKFRMAFVQELKGLQPGIIKTSSSLRTTLAVSSLSLIAELAAALETSFDPLCEAFLAHCLSMAGQTKKIVAGASQSSARAILEHAPHHTKHTQLLVAMGEERTPAARAAAGTHFATLSQVSQQHAAAFESAGEPEMMAQSIKKGLADANPAVKDSFRAAYWAFATAWPVVAQALFAQLDPAARKQLERSKPSATPVATSAPSRSPAKPARPSMRDMIAQAKASKTAAPPAAIATESPMRSNGATESPARARVSRFARASTQQPPQVAAAAAATALARPHSPVVPTKLARDQPQTPSRGGSSLSSSSRVSSTHQDAMVDEALQSQAAQAEQAAERLLELGDDEDADHGTGMAAGSSPLGPGGVPVSAEQAESRTVTPLPMLARHSLSTPEPPQSATFDPTPDASTTGTPREALREPPADLSERTQEIDECLTRVREVEPTVSDLRTLGKLARERPVATEDADDEVLATEYDWSSFWRIESRFKAVLSGLTKLLQRAEVEPRLEEASLSALLELVQHQYGLFSGDEGEFVSLLLQLRRTSQQTVLVDDIADAFCRRTEPLYGLGSVRSSLHALATVSSDGTMSVEPDKVVSFVLGLRLVGGFLERLPAEVLEEDELPKVLPAIRCALNDRQSGQLRRVAVQALASAHKVLQDQQRIFDLVGGLASDQTNLLAYYFRKS